MREDLEARAEAAFHEIADLTLEERAAALERLRVTDAALAREVGQLVAAMESDDGSLDPAPIEPGPSLPERFGGYRILRLIGEGGMGAVYEAEQEHPRRRVALKVVRAGLVSPAAMRRFEYEADVLGQLQHPGIAQVYAAGSVATAIGAQPYFAMELIEGVTLDAYVRQAMPSVRDRLALMGDICDAVHHAHTRGVIHRDLKPANILVEKGPRARIVDFGVARIADDEIAGTLRTMAGQIVGTLGYMSPEQLSGEPGAVDARSDVYALGAILYEVLAGRAAFNLKGRSLPEAARLVREAEPARLGTVDRGLRGDIETIVAKAMEKERGRRYQSAAALGEDLRRFLRHEPILARPATTAYQALKFARRHKALVGAIGVVLVVSVSAAVVSTVLYFRAEEARKDAIEQTEIADRETQEAIAAREREKEQREIADRERLDAIDARDEAFSVLDFIVNDMLAAAAPERSMGKKLTVEEVVTAAAERVGQAFAGRPKVEAAVRFSLGSTFRRLGDMAKAEHEFTESLRLQREHGSALLIARAANSLAIVKRTLGKLDEAEALYTEAAGIWGEGEASRADHAATLVNIVTLMSERAAYDEAEPLGRRAAALHRELFGDRDERTAMALDRWGGTLQGLERFAEAVAARREAVAILTEKLPADHPSLATARIGLAVTLAEGNIDLNEARGHADAALETFRKVLRPGHPSAAIAAAQLAGILMKQGDWAGAEALFRESIEMFTPLVPENHHLMARYRSDLGLALLNQGRLDEAEAVLLEGYARGSRSKDYPATDWQILVNRLVTLYDAKGNEPEATKWRAWTPETAVRVAAPEPP